MQLNSLAAYRLPEHGPHRRISIRAETDKQAGFDARHDDLTLVYNTFLSPNGARILLVSPSLRNLFAPFASARFSTGTQIVKPLVRPLDRCVRTVLPIAGPPDSVTIDGPLGHIRLTPQPNQNSLFRGKRVLLTKSKDNELAWIKYWVEFNVRVHGANAVLIYDNASTKYTRAELDHVVTNIPGVERAVVVGWPFPFGPGAGPQGVWDSDYCQYGVLEDARWRFLAAANGVLYTDVDELAVISPAARLFDILQRSPTGYLRFNGVWVSTARDQNAGAAHDRHTDFVHLDLQAPACEAKWAVVPARCPAGFQWRVHAIPGMTVSRPRDLVIKLRHFRGISTNWKARRTEPEALDPGRHRRDEALVAAMHRAR
jgi:hypothetical protein